jgi:hypothetical protein
MKTIVMCLLSLLMLQTVTAQKLKLPQAKSVGSGAVMKNQQLGGYFGVYYLDDNADKTSTYELVVFDPNMVLIYKSRFNLKVPQKNFYAYAATFNGNLLTLKCSIREALANHSKFFLFNFDEKGAFINNQQISLSTSNYNSANYLENQNLIAVEGIGNLYIQNGRKSSKIFLEMAFVFNDTTQPTWQYKTNEKKHLNEYGFHIGHTEQTILCLVEVGKEYTKPTIQGFDLKTGKKQWEKPMNDSSYHCRYERAIQIDAQTWRLIGHYYDRSGTDVRSNDNTKMPNSLGLVSCLIDAQGTILKKEYLEWETVYEKKPEITSKPATDPTDSIKKVVKTLPPKGKDFLVCHQFLKADNKIFVIAEHYYNQPKSFKSVLMIGNLYVLELDLDFKLQRLLEIEKPALELDRWSGEENGIYTISASIELFRFLSYFQYEFTQVDKAQSSFTVAYLESKDSKTERSFSKKKKQPIFHFVNYADGKLSRDKVEMNKLAEKSGVFPTKTGYVTVWEDFGDKETAFRMEKLNFDY